MAEEDSAGAVWVMLDLGYFFHSVLSTEDLLLTYLKVGADNIGKPSRRLK